MQSSFVKNTRKKTKHEFPDDDLDYKKVDTKRKKHNKDIQRQRREEKRQDYE